MGESSNPWWLNYVFAAGGWLVATPSIFIVVGILLVGTGIYFTARPVQKTQPVQETSPSPTTLCWDGPCPPTHKKNAPEYLKEFGLSVGGSEPLWLNATPVITTDRLRIFVDYSEYRNGWMPKTRAFIGEIKEPVKGKTERLQLIHYLANKPNAGTNALWWGDPSHNYPATTPGYSSNLPAILVRARLAIVGQSGEQHHYFMLVRSADNVGTYVGILPEHDSGDWIETWENE